MMCVSHTLSHAVDNCKTVSYRSKQDRVRDAPPVVLICSEACALAEASSWFVSRYANSNVRNLPPQAIRQ